MDYVSVVAVVSTGVALYLGYKASKGYVDRRIDDVYRYLNDQTISEVKDLQRMISDNVGIINGKIDDIERVFNDQIVDVTRSIDSRIDDMDRYLNDQIVSEVKDLQRMISDNVDSIDQEAKLSDARYDGMIDTIFKRLEKLEDQKRVPLK